MEEDRLLFVLLYRSFEFIKTHFFKGRLSYRKLSDEINHSELNKNNIRYLLNVFHETERKQNDDSIRKCKIILDYFNKEYGSRYEVKQIGDDYEIRSKKEDVIKDETPKSIHKIPNLTDELPRQVRKGEIIRILDSWTPEFANPSMRSLRNWLNKGPRSFQLLILDPFSFFVEKRCDSLPIEITFQQARHEILGILKNLIALKEEYPAIEVRLYNETNGVNLCVIGKRIFYSPFIKGKYTEDTYAFEINETDHNNRFKELVDHFDALWNSAEQVDHEKLKELQEENEIRMRDNKQLTIQLSYLSNKYYLFNLDDKDAKFPFQLSMIEISNEDDAMLSFNERQENRQDCVRNIKGKVQLSGEYNIAFRFKKDSFYLKLVARKRSGENDAKLVECVYLHYDQDETSRSSIGLMIATDYLQKSSSSAYEQLKNKLVSRLTDNIPIEVQWYLRQERENTLEIKRDLSEWSKLEVKEVNLYNQMKDYMSTYPTWYIHYPERHPRDRTHLSDPVLNTIGFGEIKVINPSNGLKYKAKFKTGEGYELEGYLELVKTSEVYIIGCFASEEIYLALNFRYLDKEEPLWGAYSIVYRNSEQGSGLLLASKEHIRDYPKKSLDPLLESDLKWTKGMEPLSQFNVSSQETKLFKDFSRINFQNLVGRFELYFEDSRFKTRFEMEVFPNGYVNGYVVSKTESEAVFVGMANKQENILNVSLYSGRIKKDQGFISIDLSSAEKDTYHGVFAGIWEEKLISTSVKVIRI